MRQCDRTHDQQMDKIKELTPKCDTEVIIQLGLKKRMEHIYCSQVFRSSMELEQLPHNLFEIKNTGNSQTGQKDKLVDLRVLLAKMTLQTWFNSSRGMLREGQNHLAKEDGCIL